MNLTQKTLRASTAPAIKYGTCIAALGVCTTASATIFNINFNPPAVGPNATVSSVIDSGGFILNAGVGTATSSFGVAQAVVAATGASNYLRSANQSSTLTSSDFTAADLGRNIFATATSFGGTTQVNTLAFFAASTGAVGWFQTSLALDGILVFTAGAFSDTGSIHVGDVAFSVPEPASIALVGLGLLAAGASGVRRLRKH